MMRAIRESWAKTKAVLIAGLGASLLTACTSTDELEFAEALPCPAYGILGGTEKLTLFSGAGTDVTDVVLTAEIERVVGACEYDIQDGIIYAALAYRGVAELGPAATSNEISVPAFLALTEVNSRVLRKETYPIQLEFEDGARSIRFLHEIEETLIPYVARIDGSAYELLVGFQLTPEQVAYERRRRTR